MKLSDLTFPTEGYKGLVFDLDGTLVDSMPLHFDAWCLALEENGAPGVLPEDVFYAMGGRPTVDIVKELNGELGLTLDPGAVALSKRTAFLKNLSEVRVIEEVVTFARQNQGKVPMAVATGGTRQVAEKTLEVLELRALFEAVVTADDVEHGKPDPEVFLKAAEQLELFPEDCLVLEDAVPGIAAARAAGMQVITIPAPLRLIS